MNTSNGHAQTSTETEKMYKFTEYAMIVGGSLNVGSRHACSARRHDALESLGVIGRDVLYGEYAITDN